MNSVTLQGNILKVPNRDERVGYSFISKEVIQQSYLDAVGQTKFIFGEERTILSVEISDDWITIILN